MHADRPRFVFANQLRGLAAVCVVANHLAGVYFSEPSVVAAAIFAPVVIVAAPAVSVLAAGAWYNGGPFGVALFFLISGFVIPISLEQQSRRGFLVARAFRIYPTYVLALAIELLVIGLAAHHWREPFTYHPRVLLANALLIADLTRMPAIDLVNWTLMVELKFYLLLALIAPLVRRANLTVLAACAGFVLGVAWCAHPIGAFAPWAGRALAAVAASALYVLFMLIGVVFNYHVRGRIGARAATLAIALLFGAFVLAWPLTALRDQFPIVTVNYAYALLTFAAFYALRDRVPENRVADFFAAISYPLYCVHALIGFSVMTLLISAGWNVLLAMAAACAVAVALASALHVSVEGGSQAAGKRLAERWFPLSRPRADLAK